MAKAKELQHLLEKIYRERRFDFREYKENTLTRRLARRLHTRDAQTYADYARVLDQDPKEYGKLFDDLTINVTSFFRDAVAFKALEEMVLPRLLNQNTDTERSLRVWSAGCSTGQEPYSIAMLLLEFLDWKIRQWDVTLLATDIDAKAFKQAQEGFFTLKEAEGIQPRWLERYFVSENKGFRVRPALRELITFGIHNLVSEPPYQDLDLVVCRNVLIYFTPRLQMRMMKGFHQGLKEDGFLLLGKAEVPVGEGKVLFRCLDKKAKLYQKVREPGKEGRSFQSSPIVHQPARTSHQTSPLVHESPPTAEKVVVIAASVGGIDALTHVIPHLPVDLPAAVLVVQHLKDDRQTHLPEYLDRRSSLRTRLVQDGMPLEAGVVYVAVPGKHLRVRNGHLMLDLAEPVNYVRPSADVLFSSVAEIFGPNVVGVVLSGTGHDGARGCQKIKAKGGVTIAQNEETSHYFGMAKAAIDAGVIDFVLSLTEIPGKIVALLERGYRKDQKVGE